MSAQLNDAMQITRERLNDVKNVWLELAQSKLTPYLSKAAADYAAALEKLPEPVGRFVKAKAAGAPAQAAGESTDGPSS